MAHSSHRGRDLVAPELLADTPLLLAAVRRLEDLSLPEGTLRRWVRGGFVTPVSRSRRKGQWHQWGLADAVLVAWLARLRAVNIDVVQHRAALKRSWRALRSRVEAHAGAGGRPLFLALLGSDAVAALSKDELLGRLRRPDRHPTTIWAAPSLHRVRREAAAVGWRRS